MTTAGSPAARGAAPRHRDSHSSTATRPYDLVKEFVIALVVVGAPHRRAGGRVLLPGREGDHPADLGQGRTDRLRRDGRQRAGRHQRHRELRAAVQHATPTARSSVRSPCRSWAACGSRSTPQRLRHRPRSHQDVADPSVTAGADHAGSRRRATAGSVGERLRGRAGQGSGRRPGPGRAGRLRSGAGAGRGLPGPGPVAAAWRARCSSAGTFYGGDQTRTAAVPRRRHLPGGPGPRPHTRRRPVGDDERDGQLPRPAVDVALHVLVPGQAVLDARTTPTPRSGG